MPTETPDWSVAIFAARESPATLRRCIDAARAACGGRTAVIDVLVNGNPALAQALAGATGADREGITLRVWSLALGDKAHAWNTYVHRLWPAGTPAFFLDGYALVQPGALAALAERLARDPQALGATGVPTSGRSAPRLRAQMLRFGGLHGNLHAIGARALAALRASGFRLPLGLYRTDSLIGAVLMFGLDPATHRWDARRVAVVPEAVWEVPGASALTWRNLVGQAKRRLRQAQGELENRAVREHLAVRRDMPAALPPTVQELVNGWRAAHPEQARALFLRQPLCMHAARRLRQPRDWSVAQQGPERVLAP